MSLTTVRPAAAADWGEAGRTEYSIRSGQLTPCTSALGRTAPVGFGALPDSLANAGQSHLRLFGQFQGIINLDAEVAHGAFELGVPQQ